MKTRLLALSAAAAVVSMLTLHAAGKTAHYPVETGTRTPGEPCAPLAREASVCRPLAVLGDRDGGAQRAHGLFHRRELQQHAAVRGDGGLVLALGLALSEDLANRGPAWIRL